MKRGLKDNPVDDGEQGILFVEDAVFHDRPGCIVLFFQGSPGGLQGFQGVSDGILEAMLYDLAVGLCRQLLQLGFGLGDGGLNVLLCSREILQIEDTGQISLLKAASFHMKLPNGSFEARQLVSAACVGADDVAG